MAYNIYTNLFVGQAAPANRSISEPIKTTDKSLIKNWVETHKGKPALLQEGPSQTEPVLCLNFPGTHTSASGQEISWDEFFGAFDAHNFVMVYRELPEGATTPPFCKLMRRKAW
jgi:hypothetical protein